MINIFEVFKNLIQKVSDRVKKVVHWIKVFFIICINHQQIKFGSVSRNKRCSATQRELRPSHKYYSELYSKNKFRLKKGISVAVQRSTAQILNALRLDRYLICVAAQRSARCDRPFERSHLAL